MLRQEAQNQDKRDLLVIEINNKSQHLLSHRPAHNRSFLNRFLNYYYSGKYELHRRYIYRVFIIITYKIIIVVLVVIVIANYCRKSPEFETIPAKRIAKEIATNARSTPTIPCKRCCHQVITPPVEIR